MRSDRPLTQQAKEAIALAEAFPKCGFVDGKAYHEEFERVVARLGYRVPDGEMTDETCVHCTQPKLKPDLNYPSIYEARKYLAERGAKPVGDNTHPVYLEWMAKL